MKKILIGVILFFLFLEVGTENICFGQTTPSRIERSQEILEKEEALREKLEEEKVFIKKIVVEGATLLTEEEVKEIVIPFQNRWLSKNEIQQILDLISSAYKEKGYIDKLKDISFRTKKSNLIITVKELTP